MTLYDSIASFLASNPILVGGVGTLIAGSVLYVLRAVPQAIYQALDRALWTKLSVESYSNEYREVDQYIEKRRIDFFSRSLEIRDGLLQTGFGSGWGTYDGRLFAYSKAKVTQQFGPLETISVAFLTRDRGIVERFICDSKPEEQRNSIDVKLYTGLGYQGSLRKRKRGLDTVFVDPAIKTRLVDRITWFLGSEEWHRQRGIPWKLGIVLHGPPGTGKTSLIQALASDFGFNIKYIKSLHGLGAAFLTVQKDDIFVIEDIDTMSAGLSREGANDNGKGDGNNGGASGGSSANDMRVASSPLHEILNVMDGIQTPDGLKFIVTTNHLKRLDPALVRPGRIDEVIEVGPLPLESARAMFKAFYGREGLVAGHYKPRTGAELQQMFSQLGAEEAERELMSTNASPVLAVSRA